MQRVEPEKPTNEDIVGRTGWGFLRGTSRKKTTSPPSETEKKQEESTQEPPAAPVVEE